MKHSSPSFGKAFYPLLSIAMLSVLVAGCSGSTTTTTTTTTDTTATSSIADQTDTTASSSAADQTNTTGDSSAMADTSSDTAAVTGKKYSDGTYSAVGNYTDPSGPESVNISLTLKDGIITDATYQGNATGMRAKQMQQAFGDGYKEQVVGKSIDSLSLGVINGSSLTPMGFMDAVAKIKAQASA